METDERRKYFRVQTILPFKFKKFDECSPEAVQTRNTNISFRASSSNFDITENNLPSLFDKEIFPYLKRIDEKLTFIIKALDLKGGEEFCPGDSTEIILSANGLSFPSESNLEKSELLSIEIDLPGQISSHLILKGKVISCKKISKDLYNVSVTFIDIHPPEEEKIVKYTLARQRESIKKH